jgi:iron(III) transport system ATP-binding protein
VPQDGALFPHLTVRGNIAFGLHRRHRRQAAGLEEMVGLGGLSRRYPHQLSGGQQQRVALARALAIKPAVVLLDEPFGSLDVHLRAGLRAEVLAILRAANATTVLVTHDQDEALSVADHLAVIEAGRLLAHGRPRDLYERPPSPRVATAIGTANILPGRLHAGRVQCAVGEFAAGEFGVATAPGEHSTECLVMVRPENLHLGGIVTAGAPSATVTGLAYHGHDTMIDLRLNAPGSTTLVARVSTPPPAVGATVALATAGLPHIWVQGT